MSKNIAIVGVTGLVGSTFLKVIEEKKIKFNNLYFYASNRSAGKVIKFLDNDYTVMELKDKNIRDDIDFALFSAGGSISLEYAPKFAAKGAIVIDNSSAWRMDEEVPLIVPESNPEEINNIKKGIIANPNCSTIQVIPVLKELDKHFGLKRVIYSTYQSTSGAGIKGLNDLDRNLSGEESIHFPSQILYNVIPHIDSFMEDGYTKEEIKMINETRKILNLPNLRITSTCVRVPVKYSHSVSVNVELNKDFNLEEVRNILSNSKNIIVIDNIKEEKYPMPIDAQDRDEVFVGRIRRDKSVDYGLNLWIVADNIRKGAATNAVQIMELML